MSKSPSRFAEDQRRVPPPSLSPSELPDVIDSFCHSAHVLDRLSGPACIMDVHGSVSWLNGTWKRLAGLGTGGHPVLELGNLLHPAQHRLFLDALSAGGSSHFECRIGEVEAEGRWYLFQVHRQRLGPDHRDYFLCIGVDVHERKMREDTLEALVALQTEMLGESVDCIKAVSVDGRLLHMNRAGCHALGVPLDSTFGMHWLPLLPEGVRPAGEAALQEAYAGRPGRFPGVSIVPGQPAQYWDNLLNPVRGPDGDTRYVLCVSREISKEKLALDAFALSRERLQMAVLVGELGIWDYDILNDRLSCDGTWAQIMGLEGCAPIQRLAQFRALIHPEDRERATEISGTATELLQSGKDYGIVYRIVRPDGEIRWVRSAARLEYVDAVPVRAVGFVSDITEAWCKELELQEKSRVLEEERDALERQSLEDALTGIGNRRCFERVFPHALEGWRTAGGGGWIGIVDVDDFKSFNDLYGHVAGDQALRSIAQTLSRTIGDAGVVARIGGEEFAFLLNAGPGGEVMLEKIVASIEALQLKHSASPRGIVTISCGCAPVELEHRATYVNYMRTADLGLYAAKQSGKGCYVINRIGVGESVR